MEVIGKLQEHDKLSTTRQDFYIDKPSYAASWMRAMRGDRYDLNVQSIEGNIDELLRCVMSLRDSGYTRRAIEHLRNARRGLVNLERTYIDRVQAQAAILVLRQDLDVRIGKLAQYAKRTFANFSIDEVALGFTGGGTSGGSTSAGHHDEEKQSGHMLLCYTEQAMEPVDKIVNAVVYRSDEG